MTIFKLMAIGAVGGWLGACGASAPTVEQTAAPEAAIREAEAIGAGEIPQASLHLKLASDQYTAAKRLIEDGENARAKLVLERAHADAEVARQIAQMEATRKQADAAERQIQKLMGATEVR